MLELELGFLATGAKMISCVRVARCDFHQSSFDAGHSLHAALVS